ncbi:4-hydroxybenzoate polyprenyltransferase [Mycobacterium sp. MAA66]|uniref:UbiA family prenyltransferase n=1 Tax=Mycobacterium sp. MAA66 TaxID=3156297 RepID=UPI0035195BA0
MSLRDSRIDVAAATDVCLGSGIERWYSGWGLHGPTAWRMVLAHVRMVRPTTRLWLDTLMPLTVIAVLTDGRIPWRIALPTVAAMNLLHIAATVLNDVKDRDTDRLSQECVRRTRPIAVGVIAPRAALVEAILCAAIGLGLTALVRWQLTVVAVILVALIAQHELPPIRTQGRPIIGQIAGVTGLSGILAWIVVAVGTPPPAHAVPFLLYVVVYLGIGEMLVKDVRDCDNDAKGGKTTTSVRYGAAAATAAACAAYACATACWWWFVAGAPPGIALPWLLAGAVVLIGWTVITLFSARRFRLKFVKATARRLHRGSALTFTVVSAALLLGYLS